MAEKPLAWWCLHWRVIISLWWRALELGDEERKQRSDRDGNLRRVAGGICEHYVHTILLVNPHTSYTLSLHDITLALPHCEVWAGMLYRSPLSVVSINRDCDTHRPRWLRAGHYPAVSTQHQHAYMYMYTHLCKENVNLYHCKGDCQPLQHMLLQDDILNSVSWFSLPWFVQESIHLSSAPTRA